MDRLRQDIRFAIRSFRGRRPSTPRGVFCRVMRHGGSVGLAGAAIGLGIAYLSGRVVASRVYAIRASDSLMLGIAITVVAAMTVMATAIPAWRASRLEPSGVLHSE